MRQRIRHPLITPDRLRKRAIIYLRQSSMAQVQENWGSTSLQRDQKDLARAFGWPDSLIEVIDEDLGRSGASTGHRTGWQDLLRQIPSGTVSAIFAFQVSRLSREMRDFEELRVMAKLYGVILVVDGKPADPRDPNDTVLLQMQAAFAQLDNHSRAKGLSRARREKARLGSVVSRLPVGWIKLSDGSYDFEPTVKQAIAAVYPTFWEQRSVLATVRALTKTETRIPVRRGRRIVWKAPDAGNIRQFLVHPAYAGFYVYGTSENRPDLGLNPKGYPKRRKAPEENWIVVPDHHPAYISANDQERIKAILQAKCFSRRQRPGRGPALAQGLLYCRRCGVRLSVLYPQHTTHRYECQKNPTTFGRINCFEFRGTDVDQAIERIVLQRLAAPPLEELRKALREARAGERTHAELIDAERNRLAYEERVARDRYEQCDPRNRLVAADAEERLEGAMQARISFEQRQALAPPRASVNGTEEELRSLCELVRDLPGLWHHPVVTHQERKEILACLIERIVVDADKERITGRIHWRSCAQTEFTVLRRAGVHRLIEELNGKGLTVPEIDRWLRRGHPETGQSWTYWRSSIHLILRRAGLVPNVRSLSGVARRQLQVLRAQARTLESIAEEMNRCGFVTAKGNSWTSERVRTALRDAGERTEEGNRSVPEVAA